MFSQNMKSGKHTLQFYCSDDKTITNKETIDLNADTDYYITLDKESDTIKIDIKSAFPHTEESS